MMLPVPDLSRPRAGRVRRSSLISFQRSAGISFRDISLLDLAFCHRSYVNELPERIDNNELLEFLGDSVLGLVIADYLFRLLPDRKEGNLAKIKSHVVSEDSLARAARRLGVSPLLRLGKGEDKSGGRDKDSVLSDCMEAIIGALFIDSGLRKTNKFIISILSDSVAEVISLRHNRDYKSLLQERSQKMFHNNPKYVLERYSGPDHQKNFWICVQVNGVSYGPCEGRNKKTAEQEAARKAYMALKAED